MKNDKLLEYILSIALICILFFNLFVLNIFVNKYIFVIFLLIYILISKIFIKSVPVSNINKKKIILLVLSFSIIYVGILYIIGLFVEFYENPIAFNLKGIYSRIFPAIAIIVLTEIIRKLYVTRNHRDTTILITIALVLIDIVLNINLYKILNLEEVLALIGSVILASISTNLFGNYIVKRYGVIPNILYRVITTIYIYIFSILPDIYIFFQSAYKIIVPYIMYLIIDCTFERDKFTYTLKEKKINIVTLIITIIIAIGVVALVSCKFKYGIIVVGSSSMANTINKGDAVIFEKYEGQKLEEGQIIIFKKDNIITVHRIKDVQMLNSDMIFYTQGDNNQQRDDGYRTQEDIIGIVKLKVQYIGWPTIWVNELFEK